MQKLSLFLWRVCCLFLFAIGLFSENIPWFSSMFSATQTVSAQSQELQEARQQSAEVQRLIAARKFNEALPLAERVLKALQIGLWAEHPEVATALTRLATIHRNLGNYPEALSLNQRALTIAERVAAPGHPELGQIVTEMGVIYFQQNDLVQAEEAFLRALEIWKSLKLTDPNIVRVTGNLAAVYGIKNDFAKSRPLLEPLVKAIEKEGGPEDPRLINPLINLGTGYFQEYRFAEAEPYYRRVIKLLEKLPGEKPPVYSGAISSLGSIMTTRGEFAESEKLQRQALALRGGAEKETTEVGDSLSLLAINFAYQGKFAEAEPLQLRSLAIAEKVQGPEHPNVAHRLNSLMHFHTARGDFAKAITTLTRATEVSELGLAYNIAAGSEREKLAYLSTFDRETNRTLSLHLDFAPNDETARKLALTTVLRRKARALDAMIDSLDTLRRRATPEDRALLDQLGKVRSEIAQLFIRPLPPRTTRADQQKRLRELNEQREKLEAQISRSSAEFRVQSQPVTPKAIRDAIPDGAVLVEFIVYRPFNSRFNRPENQFGAPHYVAYVLQRTGEERWVKLGNKREIDDAIEKLRKALRNRRRRDVKVLARAVDKLVMQPIRPLLGQSRRVLLAPDGSLNLVPFAALVDERNQYLVQNYTFSYLSSGRDLLRLSVRTPRQRTAIILSNPDFGPGSGNASAEERILRYRQAVSGDTLTGTVLADAYFPPLPATVDEAEALKSLLPEAKPLAQGEATETALKTIAAPGILHIATHGFFLGDLSESGQRGPLLDLDAVRGGNPLLRSGLALAGANTLMSGKDDGILTALEAASLNLWGTNLVVLSACDTGVGEVKTGEGVYGLRRALLLAGSETQVMSLWPVSDKGTRDLMIGYYRRLQRGEGRADALRAAQLQILKAPITQGRNYNHPYYWASFIQSGEWANLDGQR